MEPIIGHEFGYKLAEELKNRAVNAGANILVGVVHKYDEDHKGHTIYCHVSRGELVNMLVALCERDPLLLLEVVQHLGQHVEDLKAAKSDSVTKH